MNPIPFGVRWGPLRRLRNRLAIWAYECGLFAELDSFAWTQGWQVERGLTRRVYRDRRFDALAECRRCHGVGEAPARSPCAACSGTGRVNVAEQPGSQV
ncbi:hypothetical protein AB0K60_05350 [Thermopolyspora sp. NPDC052614]|uniref:hypothetical protein n=1 Tax=Thermopolyspora sp. NPDC052614 TaxID=3155682 RepID=UPI00343D38AB